MIDLNHQPKFHEQVSMRLDAALQAERSHQARRRYLGASRLGVPCERALQYEYVASIGMDRPLADYGKDEVLRLVEVVVDAYQAHMLAEHERMVERDRTFFEQLASRKATASTGGDHHRIPF